MTRALLCDLDGVIRHWPADAPLEAELGLPAGTIRAAAFAEPLFSDVVTGVVSDEAWRSAVEGTLAAQMTVAAAREATRRWSEPRGRVDPHMLALLAEIRERAPVCLASNATTRLESDLAELGLEDCFDAVVNSSRVGLAKPDPRIYALAAGRLGAAPADCAFVDDLEVNVAAAAAAGMAAVRFTGVPALRDRLRPLGLLG